jgi:hypothetical protein
MYHPGSLGVASGTYQIWAWPIGKHPIGITA